jgi:hypothetical protein
MSQSNDSRIEAEEFLRKANKLMGVDAHALDGQRRPGLLRTNATRRGGREMLFRRRLVRD